ncbi:MAG: sodium:proton antiporter [Bifidobacteriaceae bacterium]|nr:sodium:proton antiporter [Bifidobacteriaceae bacterium]
MDAVLLGVGAVAAILGAMLVSAKTRIGAPLLLVALGMGVSLLPAVPAIEIEPEWILAGVLPPLLYSSAVRMPLVDFRRDLGLIGAFSVALVVVSAVIAGLAIHLAVPGLPLHVAIALGAVLSPTDAAATAIVRRVGAPGRLTVILDGESLLNDATSLVTLRTAVAGGATLTGAAGDFCWAVAAAGVVGWVVGQAALRLGAKVADPAAHTLFSFLVPFAAYLPVEWLGSSGLVAVVAAGLVTGQGAHRWVSARNRIAGRANWETVDALAEGAVFLAMGLQVFALHQTFVAENDSLTGAIIAIGVGWVSVLAVRAVFTAGALFMVGPKLRTAADRLRWRTAPSFGKRTANTPAPGGASGGIGWREAAALEWAGMRGVVTLAAAQTLPLDTPERPALVLIAFGVATVSLMVQGLTLGPVLRRLGLTHGDAAALDAARVRLRRRLSRTARGFLAGEAPELRRPDGQPYSKPALALARSTSRWVTVPEVDTSTPAAAPGASRRQELRQLRLATIRALRRDLLAVSRTAAFPSSLIAEALDDLDREELAIDVAPET